MIRVRREGDGTRRWTGLLVLGLPALVLSSGLHPQAGQSAYLPERFDYLEGHAYMGSVE